MHTRFHFSVCMYIHIHMYYMCVHIHYMCIYVYIHTLKTEKFFCIVSMYTATHIPTYGNKNCMHCCI